MTTTEPTTETPPKENPSAEDVDEKTVRFAVARALMKSAPRKIRRGVAHGGRAVKNAATYTGRFTRRNIVPISLTIALTLGGLALLYGWIAGFSYLIAAWKAGSLLAGVGIIGYCLLSVRVLAVFLASILGISKAKMEAEEMQKASDQFVSAMSSDPLFKSLLMTGPMGGFVGASAASPISTTGTVVEDPDGEEG